MRTVLHSIVGLYVFLLPVFPFFPFYFFDSEILVWTCLLALGGIGVRWRKTKKQMCTVTIVDFLVFLLCFWSVLSVVVIRRCAVDALLVYGWVVMCLLYVWCRTMQQRDVLRICSVLALSGAVQGVWALCQQAGYGVSPHTEFPVTGSFPNPGPLGGYLAVAFMGAFSCFRQTKSWLCRMWYGVLLLPIGTALVCTESRAAWLSVLVASFCLMENKSVELVTQHLKKRSQRWVGYLSAVRWVLLPILFAGILYGLYQYKRTSADVRLLIWTVAVDMITDAPLCGHGVASFPMLYMDYQGEYLMRHPDSSFKCIADNNTQAFNEPLSLACEQGMVGCVLVVLLFLFVCRSRRNEICRWPLLAMCVFSCFSYPTDWLALKLLFPLLFGMVSSGRTLFTFSADWKSGGRIVVGVVGVLLVGAGLGLDKHYREAFGELANSVNYSCRLPHHQKYMARYAMRLFEEGDYHTYCQVVDSGSFPFQTSVVRCDLGMAYCHLGDVKRAEELLWSAHRMVPAKVLPRFYLFRIYRDTGDETNAVRMAKEIVSMQVGQVGTIYLEARTEASSYLKETLCVPPHVIP